MKMNLPNKLTVLRMMMIPFFMVIIMFPLLGEFWSRIAAAIIFGLTALTDMLDGKIARKYNYVSDFGKFLDPLADKMLTTAALLGFMKFGLCNIWVLMIVLTLEFTVTGMRMIATVQNVVIPANVWGKIKTVTQMTFSLVVMLFAELIEDFNIIPYETFAVASNVAMWIIAAFTFISGAIYVVQAVKVIDFSK